MPDQFQIINIPGVGKVRFPTSMSDEDVTKAVAKLHDEAAPKVDGVVSKEEPGTWWGGFKKSVNEQAEAMGKSLFKSAAYPENSGDFLSLMLPGSMEAAGAAKGVDSSLRSVTNKAGVGLEKAGIASRPSSLPLAVTDALVRGKPMEAAGIAASPYAAQGAGKVLQKVSKLGEEPSILSQIDRYGGNTSGFKAGDVAPAADRVVGNINEMPLHEQMQHFPETANPDRTSPKPFQTEGGRPLGQEYQEPIEARPAGTKAPTLEEALTKVLQNGDEEKPSLSTGAPEATTAGEGALKQSGKFKKGGKQAGGYSSGRPSTSPATLEQGLQDELGGQASDVSSEAVAVPASDPPTSAASAPPDVQSLRESLGSKGAASKLGMSAEDVKAQTASGPYNLPEEARTRITADLERLTTGEATQAQLDEYIAKASPLVRHFIGTLLQP